MSAKIPFSHFYACRNGSSELAIDRVFANNVSVFLAFVFYKLKISPNQVTVMSGILGISSLALSILLPSDLFVSSIIYIFVFAQFSYFFDCSDGLLARSTDNTSVFGEFFDHTLDVFVFFVVLGGFFLYINRYYESKGDYLFADLSLLSGAFIIFTHVSRFIAWNNFNHIYGSKTGSSKKKENIVVIILKNIMDHQVSLFGMLLFLLNPILAFALYFVQGIILLFVFFRYFHRAYHEGEMIDR